MLHRFYVWLVYGVVCVCVCVCRGRYYTIRWHVGGAQGLRSRQVAMKTSGFLSLLHMVILHTAPDPISPWVLRYAIEGLMGACIIDHAFMQLIDPDLYKTLRPWRLHDQADALPDDPLDGLFQLLTAADVDVSCVGLA